jgi:hypothetical protein
VGAASLRGSAVLDSGSVRLTPNSLDQEGSLVIENLDPGRAVRGFDASFTLAMGPAGVTLADGVSFSFGPPPAGTYGESGAPTGLVVTFDLWDNGESPTPPVIRVVVNGTQVAAQQVTLDSGELQLGRGHVQQRGAPGVRPSLLLSVHVRRPDRRRLGGAAHRRRLDHDLVRGACARPDPRRVGRDRPGDTARRARRRGVPPPP